MTADVLGWRKVLGTTGRATLAPVTSGVDAARALVLALGCGTVAVTLLSRAISSDVQ